MMLFRDKGAVRRLYYENHHKQHRVKRCYYNDFLVYEAAFITRLKCKLASVPTAGKKMVPNPAWPTWKTEYDRLVSIRSEKYSALESAISSAESRLGLSEAKAAVREAKRHLKDCQRTYSDMQSHLAQLESAADALYDKWYEIYHNEGEVQYDVAGKKAASDQALADWKAWTASNPEPPKDNPAWATWKQTYDSLADDAQDALQIANDAAAAVTAAEGVVARADQAVQDAEAAYNEDPSDANKSALDSAKNALRVASENLTNCQEALSKASSDYNTAKGKLDRWKSQEPSKTSPEWDEWDRTNRSYQQAYSNANLAYYNAKSQADEYARDKIKNDRGEYYQAWLAWDDYREECEAYASGPLAQAQQDVTDKEAEVSRIESAVQNDPEVVSARNAYNSADSAVNSWAAQEPPKKTKEDCTYYYYNLSVSFETNPKLPEEDSNDYIEVKMLIDNPQTQAIVEDADFVDVNKGNAQESINLGRYDVNNTSKTRKTSWASMDMIYTDYIIQVTLGNTSHIDTYEFKIDKNELTKYYEFKWVGENS